MNILEIRPTVKSPKVPPARKQYMPISFERRNRMRILFAKLLQPKSDSQAGESGEGLCFDEVGEIVIVPSGGFQARSD